MKGCTVVGTWKIEVTQNYGQFKKLKGHRDIDEKHLKRLLDFVSKEYFGYQNNVLLHKPIMVNEKMEVVDGQHRIEIAKKLKLPICYRICEGAGVEQAIRANTVRLPRKGEILLQKFTVSKK